MSILKYLVESLVNETINTIQDVEFFDEGSARDIISEYTHYKSGGKSYPRTQWAGWFQGADSRFKNDIAKDILRDDKLHSAMLSLFYHMYKRDIGFDGDFEEFLETPIDIYRGVRSNKDNYKSGGFDSYSLSKDIANSWAKLGDKNSDGEIIHKQIKPIDTLGAVQYIMDEIEVLVPNDTLPSIHNDIDKKNWDRFWVGNLGSADFSDWIEQNDKDSYDKLISYEDSSDYTNGMKLLRTLYKQYKQKPTNN